MSFECTILYFLTLTLILLGGFIKRIEKSAYLEALPFFAISETASFWDNLEDLTRKPYDATSAPAWAQEWRTAKIKICDLLLKIHYHYGKYVRFLAFVLGSKDIDKKMFQILFQIS